MNAEFMARTFPLHRSVFARGLMTRLLLGYAFIACTTSAVADEPEPNVPSLTAPGSGASATRSSHESGKIDFDFVPPNTILLFAARPAGIARHSGAEPLIETLNALFSLSDQTVERRCIGGI